MRTPTTPQAMEQAIRKLTTAQNKYPDKDRGSKLAEFKAIYAKMDQSIAVSADVHSTGKNNSRANSISGINHMLSWVDTLKTTPSALGFK